MEKKNNPIQIIIVTFLICFCIRCVELLVFRLDETIINENFIHKLLGILILAVVLKKVGFTWKSIGFDFKRFLVPTLLGLGLGLGRFAIAYIAEFIMLSAQGARPTFEVFMSGFNVTGKLIILPDYLFIVVCVFNILNAIMEEGIFRGLFIKLAENKYKFMKANVIAAVLFGIWHVVLPFRGYLDGAMSFTNMLFISIGYIILSGSISLIWGMLFDLSGVLWIGMADHFVNNTIINTLHITTINGTDEYQIARTIIAQTLSLVLVTLLYLKRRKSKERVSLVSEK